LEHIKGNLVFGTNGPLFKKKYLSGKLLFDEQLIISQEWEFFSRLLMTKPNFSILKKVLYVYRNETDGKRKIITREKFANKIKSYSKVVSLYNKQSFLGSKNDFEIRKCFFLISKLNIKRSFKRAYYTEIFSLFRIIVFVVNFNFFKQVVLRVLKKNRNYL